MMKGVLAGVAAMTISAMVLTAPAPAAEPWEGLWTGNPNLRTCDTPSVDGPPLLKISKSVMPGGYTQCGTEGDCQTPAGDNGQIDFEQQADPWVCYITKVTNVRDLTAWIFDLECGGEGEIWRTRSIVMGTADPNVMTAYNLLDRDGGVALLRRCHQ